METRTHRQVSRVAVAVVIVVAVVESRPKGEKKMKSKRHYTTQ